MSLTLLIKQKPSIYLRTNTLKISRDELIEKLKENGLKAYKVSIIDEAIRVENLKDIENNEAYVLEEDGVILGTCMVTIHGEPAYNRIEGKWILNCPYICVHRIAVDNEYKGKGLASTILDQVVAMYPDYHSVRMDTHHDNLSMQSFLTKYGFKYCGEITLKSGALRRAYEKRI